MLQKITLVLAIILSVSACNGEVTHDPILETPMENIESVPDDEGTFEGEILSFNEDILPIVQARCTACHSEGSGLPFWEDYEQIFTSKDAVRLRVVELQDMPRGNVTGMTDEERELFAMWIDQGALE